MQVSNRTLEVLIRPSRKVSSLAAPHDSYPFLRMQLLNFQVNNAKSNQLVNLATTKTQIELREKHRAARDHVESTEHHRCLDWSRDLEISPLSILEPARMKFPVYNEKDKCVAFDAGLMNKIKRQIIIRIQANQVVYMFESDLDALKKLADGHRHQVQSPLTLPSTVPDYFRL